MPVVGGVAPAVVGDKDTVTVSGSNFPKGRARCRFGEQVIVESQAVWRDGLRCQVPPRHKDEDSKASRVVEVAFEGSDFLKTRTSIAHVLRPPSSGDVTRLVQGAIKDLKTIYPSSGSLFGGTPVDVKGPPGFMSNVSGGYCVFDDDIGTLEVMSNTTVRCRAPSGRQPGSVQVMVRAGLELHGGVTYEYRTPPSVLSIEPSVGSITGGTSVLLSVSQFRASDDARCYFGHAWTNASVEDDTSIRCTVPMSGKPKKVQVSASYNGGRDRSDNGPLFSYRESLSIDKVEPALLSEVGGSSLKLFGRGFQQGDTAEMRRGWYSCTCHRPERPHGDLCFTARARENQSLLVTPYGRSPSVNVTYHSTIDVESVAPQQCPATGGCLLEMRGAFFPAFLVMPLRRPDRARICDQKHGVAMQGAAACRSDTDGGGLGERRGFCRGIRF